MRTQWQQLRLYQALIVEDEQIPASHSGGLELMRRLGLPVCPDIAVFDDTAFDELAAYFTAVCERRHLRPY